MQVMSAIEKWPKFSGEKVEILKSLFLAGESMNVENFVKFFTDDASYQFSNFPIAYGSEGIKESSTDFLKKVEGVHHHIKKMWEMGENEMVVEMEVTYIRHDGKVFTLPCSDIIRFKGDKIQEMLIFMDISPVYATPEAPTESMPEKVPGSKLTEIVKRLFALTDVKIEDFDLEAYISFFTEDAFYKAGSAEHVFGAEGIRQFSTPVIQKFSSLAHEVKNIWQVGDTVICQVVVIYNRKDGKVFKLPTLNIIRFKGEKISSLQAFGDPSPAFS
jgi:ketosteroid isomerase-like protein